MSPFLGKPLKNRNDFCAFSGLPFDANHIGVSGTGINKSRANILVPQLIALTRRQFVCNLIATLLFTAFIYVVKQKQKQK